MNIHKQLTFGFELEGLFKKGLGKKLPGEFVHDGSVEEGSLLDHVSFDCEVIPTGGCSDCTETSEGEYDYCARHHARYGYEDCTASEYNSPVYESEEEVIEALESFNESNFLFDTSCGLHLHIGAKKKWKQLYSLAENYDFQRALFKTARTFCSCQSDRLDRNENFYQFFESREDLQYAFKHHEKYRFMNFHENSQTLEFRFLSPCKHRAANVRNVITVLKDYLMAEEQIDVSQEAQLSPRTGVLEVPVQHLKKPQAKLEITHYLFLPPPDSRSLIPGYNICFQGEYGEIITNGRDIYLGNSRKTGWNRISDNQLFDLISSSERKSFLQLSKIYKQPEPYIFTDETTNRSLHSIYDRYDAMTRWE